MTEREIWERGEPLIVAGFDGSAGSTAALDAALVEARRRGGRLRIVTAWRVPAPVAGFAFTAMTVGRIYDDLHDIARDGARQLVATALDHIGPGPGVPVETAVVEGTAADVLVDASADAELLVVGRRGHNKLVELLLGSTAHGCVGHANCPVLVVPCGTHSTPVVRPEPAVSIGARS
jgi:nucleotide-binding universal stress UspA family protein